ncbi:cytosine-purine permease [Clavulina sp. PMI_390]|nr:cytosine-purine permease [Clavulina sp. PMI_390]
MADLEKKVSITSEPASSSPQGDSELAAQPSWLRQWSSKLLSYGVEVHGVTPVQPEQQTYTNFINLFFLWLGANGCIITFSSGTLGPLYFGLGLRDSALCILFVNAFGALLPAYFSTFGPGTGMRQMIFARYSFGYFGAALISAANIVTFMGFLILNGILGGQALASASSGNLSWDVGIVIIALISLFLVFCGYRVITTYEKFAWLPVFIVFIIATGVGGKHLSNPPPVAPATAAQVFDFMGALFGFVVSWATLAADYTIYMPASAPKAKVFLYAYFGFLIPLVLLEILGAAFMNTAFVNDAWMAGYEVNGVAGLLAAALEPAGRFGKFCMVVIAMSVPAACAPTMYSFGISFQCVAPIFAYVPRYVFAICATAVMIPVSIVGAHHFDEALTNFLAVIGYYAASFSAVLLIEHKVYRSSDPYLYDRTAWNQWRRLPLGWAAWLAFACSFALIVPGMSEVWYTGPIAAKGTGDIGFELGFATTVVLYTIFRAVDLRFVTKRLGGTLSD